MKSLTSAVVFLFCFVGFTSFSQNQSRIEQGALPEIKDKSNVMIGSADPEAVKVVADAISACKCLTIVKSQEEADFFIGFIINHVRVITSNGSSPQKTFIGYFRVARRFKDVKGQMVLRLLWSPAKNETEWDGEKLDGVAVEEAVDEFLGEWRLLHKRPA